MKKKWWIIPVAVVALAAIGVGVFFGIKALKSTPESTEMKIYWNVNGADYYGGGATHRVDKKTGYVPVTLAVDGKQEKFNFIDVGTAVDADSLDCFGLKFNSDGVATEVVRIEEFTGGYVAKRAYVTAVNGNEVTYNTAPGNDGYERKFTVSEATAVYDGSASGPLVGMASQIAVNDQIIAIADTDGNVSTVYTIPFTAPEDVYWNAYRMWNSTSATSTREADVLGRYELQLAVNGSLETFYTRSMDVANAIDKFAARCFGLKFDEEGYITEAYDAKTAVHGTSFGSWYCVTAMDTNRLTVTRVLSGNNQGTVVSSAMAEDCKVYDVSGLGSFIGEPTELRLHDTVHCLKNSRGLVCIVFVTNRIIDSEVYWNAKRMWDSEKAQSTRTTGAGGYYYFTLAHGGKLETFKTKDKDVVYEIDSRAGKQFCLLTEGNVITKVFNSTSGTGGAIFGSWTDVTSIKNGVITTVKNQVGHKDDGKEFKALIAENCEVYNVSDSAETVGEKTTVRVGDRIAGITNVNNEVCVIFVVTRYLDYDLYWNANRSYDSVNKVTKRTPDKDGYYTFQMLHAGKEETVKTKDAAVATLIDSQGGRTVGLEVKDGIIVRAVPATSVESARGGAQYVSWVTVQSVSANGFVAKKIDSGSEQNGTVYKRTLAKNCEIVNASDVYDDHLGEYTEIQVGDTIHVYHNTANQVTHVFVASRVLSGVDIYWNQTVKKPVNGVPTRTPDGDGNYVFTFAHAGKVETLMTKNQKIAVFIDSQAGHLVALRVSGTEITAAYKATSSVQGAGGWGCSWAQVTAVNGKNFTVSKTTDGKTAVTKLTLADNAEIYDVRAGSTFAKPYTVKVGEVVQCIKNASGKVSHLQVIEYTEPAPLPTKTTHSGTHPTTASQWYKFDGKSNFSYSGCYVLTEDVTLTDAIVNAANNLNITLCLNGHTLTGPADKRVFTLNGCTFTICDCAATKGKVAIDTTANYGTFAYLYNSTGNTVLNMYDVTVEYTGAKNNTLNSELIRVCNKKPTESSYKATFNMYSGTLTGGTGKSTGAVSLDNTGIFNMYGGAISGNRAVTASVYVNKDAKVTLSGTSAIDSLYMASDTAGNVSVAGLQTGASVGIKMGTPGVIGAGTEETAKLIKCLNMGLVLSVKDNKVSMAEPVSDHQHCLCAGLTGDHTSCELVPYLPWTDATTLPTSGKYYLTCDVTLAARHDFPKGNTVSLCLNGHKITSSADACAIWARGDLNISDCKGTGTIVGKAGDATCTTLYVFNNSGASTTVCLYNGTLTYEGIGIKNGSVVRVANDASDVNIATFKMYGGTVSGACNKTSGTTQSASILLDHYSRFYMYGGTVTDTDAKGGSVYVNVNAQITVEGKVNINNVYLTSGKTVNIGASGLDAASSVGVTLAAGTGDVATTEEALKACFVAKAAEKKIAYESGKVVVKADTTGHIHCLCGGLGTVADHTVCANVTWTAWTSANTLPTATGNYYLTKDVTLTARHDSPKGNTVSICLNGHTVTSPADACAIWARGDLNITDCTGKGAIVGKANATCAAVYVFNNSGADTTLRLYGGTLKYEGTTGLKNGAVVRIANATTATPVGRFVMYGGTVSGAKNSSDVTRCASILVDNYGVFEMHGGTVTDDGAKNGSVYMGPNATFIGDGKLTVGNLVLDSGKTMQIGSYGLNAESSVGVTLLSKTGTVATVDESLKGCFVSKVSGYEIVYTAGEVTVAQTMKTLNAAPAETSFFRRLLSSISTFLRGLFI